MEAGAEDFFLLHGDNLVIERGKYLDFGAVFGDDGSTDENCFNWVHQANDGEFSLKAVDLGSESVPADRDVEKVEGKLLAAFDSVSEHNHPHACSPDRHSLVGSLDNCLIETGMLHQKSDGCRFSTGNDESVY